MNDDDDDDDDDDDGNDDYDDDDDTNLDTICFQDTDYTQCNPNQQRGIFRSLLEMINSRAFNVTE